jgi:hypothetical protein
MAMKYTATGTRRLAATAAAGVVIAAGLVGLAGTAPAAAAPAAPAEVEVSSCKIRGGMKLNTSLHRVEAFRLRVCGPEGDTTDLPVNITRNGVTVAQGVGFVTYQCQGTAVGLFDSIAVPDFPPHNYACG